MKKIPTIFKRNPKDMSEVLNEPHPDCSWVFNGEGIATRKYDGTCTKIEDRRYYKRREVKAGKKIPNDFAEVQFDEATGKRIGWIPVDPNLKENRWHMEAFHKHLPDGTYELIGPKVQGNPENAESYKLIQHSKAEILDAPRTYEALAEWFKDKDIEGVVFHHSDGRMGKIKKRDFGMIRRKYGQTKCT